MLYSRDELESRAALYCAKHQIERVESLGFGAQGIVYSTNREFAIKIHGREAGYQRERDVYLRLSEVVYLLLYAFRSATWPQFEMAEQMPELSVRCLFLFDAQVWMLADAICDADEQSPLAETLVSEETNLSSVIQS